MADTLAVVWPRTAGGSLRAVAVGAGGAVGPAVEVAAPVTADGLKAALAGAKLSAKRAVVAIPRARATVRRLDLPSVPDDDLPDLVRMQAATKSAAPVDQLALDYLPLDELTDAAGDDAPGRAALLASVPAALLTEVREVVDGAGLELAAVGLTTVGAARLIAGWGPAAGTTLAVCLDGPFAELTLMSVGPGGPRVLLSHAAHPDGDRTAASSEESDGAAAWERSLLSECSRLLIARDGAGEELAEVWVVGDGAEALAPRLAERVGGTARPAARWDALGRTGDAAAANPGVFAGAVGLAAEAPASLSLDFLSPRKRPAPRDDRLRNGLLAAAALVLLVGGGWFLLDRQKSALNDQIAGLDAQIRSDETLLKKNESILAEDDALAAWKAGDPYAAAELARLDRLLPGTDRLFLSEVAFSPPSTRGGATVEAEGFAADLPLVRVVERDLAAAGYVVRPTRTARVTGREGYPVRFTLSADLPPDPPAADPPAAAPVSTEGDPS